MIYSRRDDGLKIAWWTKLVADENFEGLNGRKDTVRIDFSFFNNLLWGGGHEGIDGCDH